MPPLKRKRNVAQPANKAQRRAFIGPIDTRPKMTMSRLSSGDEVKFFDTNLSFFVDTTGEVPATGQLSLIPQGATSSNRIGLKCVIKSIQIKGVLQLQPAALAGSDVVRIRLMLDKQANGAAAAVTDVLTSADMSQALVNMNNSERFVCLKEFTFTFNATAGVNSALAPSFRNWEFYKKVNIPMIFSSTTGAITEIRSNNIFLLAGCTAATDDLVVASGNCRLRFVG